ncbi:DUF1492 domain-containing protein [Cupriavidus gilardii]|uniref:DUF1492 domain-containing protein n=1 Tax=Cupriavidus gilardii TaxID=82541 RepID=UPI0021B49A56|nr:DUF1492 domain-containing protein [Cupriavidus gilardii]UXC37177.1 DUF1492 domain-containing protein [Cupriavidus gilardii]
MTGKSEARVTTGASMDLEKRLENWAKANRVGGPRPGYCAPWAKLADILANGPHVPEFVEIDQADADRVTKAWRRLIIHHQQLLKLSYITNMPPWIVCRKLGIRQRPHSVFDLEMASAKRALRRQLERIDEEAIALRERVAYTRRNNLIPAIAETAA